MFLSTTIRAYCLSLAVFPSLFFAGCGGGSSDGSSNTTSTTSATTSVETRGGFESGTVSPFSVCTTKSPNSVTVISPSSDSLNTSSSGGSKVAKVQWYQSGYDGTRMTKGAELCSDADTGVDTAKEAWIGFMFYLPSSYPSDKEAGLFQLFESGGCSSWAGMLIIVNDSLRISHRGNCASTTQTTIVTSLQRDAWIPVVVHMVASQASAGTVQVWVGDSATQSSPTYSATGINFGFGTWNTTTDTLASDSHIYFKFGQYNYDTANYTSGESRVTYYDNIHIIASERSDGWTAVHPTQSGVTF
ncbi:heparin lyase I family protein [Curvibacter sp. CHRR-16]|uniref:heparin lyase I family protein n=1 Tax=Curvibacter sp. CHRR-16 TaxID=2835872 RepID=UPI001BDB658B|nr:heparin lyase I family protein [Curvibacter sp. CHRR-16]MBT0569882.1 heparin lyase I family protein [Curvibacter sp. CHRR-16]